MAWGGAWPHRPPPARKVYQSHRQHRSLALAYLLHDQSTTRSARTLRYLVRKTGKAGIYLQYYLRELNKKKGARPPLRPEFREEMYAAFRDDIGLLGELTGRDLSHWR